MSGSDPTVSLNFEVDASRAVTSFATMNTALGSVAKNLGTVEEHLKGTGSATGKAGDEFAKAGHHAEDFAHQLHGLEEKLKNHTEALFFITGAVGEVIEGFKKLGEAAKFAAELENMEFHVPRESLEKLQEATEGTVDKVTLLKFAMKSMHGDLHLTSDGMEVVMKAAQRLHEQFGVETVDAAEQLTEALRRGTTRGLAPYGMAMQNLGDKTETTKEMMEGFMRVGEQVPQVQPALKKIEEAQAKWADFTTDVKQAIGDLVISIGGAIATLLGLMPDRQTKQQRRMDVANVNARRLAEEEFPRNDQEGGEFSLMGAGGGSTAERDALRERYFMAQLAREIGFVNKANDLDAEEAKKPKELFDQSARKGKGGSLEDALMGQLTKLAEQKKKGGGSHKQGRDAFLEGLKLDLGFDNRFELNHQSAAAKGLASDEFDLKSASDNYYQDPNASEMGGWDNAPTFKPGDDTQRAGSAFFGGTTGGAAQASHNDSMEAKLNDKTSAVGAAYDAMSSGLSAAVDAAISGSDNIGKAAMKAASMSLRAIAVESSVKALFWFAEGILGNPVAFAKAGQYAATAVAAGAGAALLGSMGGGGSTGGGGGGGGGSSPSTPAGGGYSSNLSDHRTPGPENQHFTIYVGDGFVGRPDELAVEIANKLSAGVRTGRVRSLSTPGAVTFR